MSWFSKAPKSKRLEDKVYINDRSKYNAISDQLKQHLANSSQLLVVYFFDETKEKIVKMLEEQQIKYGIENEYVNNLQISQGPEVHIIKAKTLNKVYNLKPEGQKLEKQVTNFLFVEHYPIFSKEEAVLNKIDELTGNKAVVCFYVSLDEPLLQVFGSDNIKGLMQKLGLKDNECIEHSFVTKSIVNAQKKIEKKTLNENETLSQGDWFKKYFNN